MFTPVYDVYKRDSQNENTLVLLYGQVTGFPFTTYQLAVEDVFKMNKNQSTQGLVVVLITVLTKG